MKFPNYVFVGIKGMVVALDRGTGDQVWATELKGSGFVNLTCDSYALYATTAGEAFCLDPYSGEVHWHNRLKGYGTGLATLLVPGQPDQNAATLAEQHQLDAEASGSAGMPGSPV